MASPVALSLAVHFAERCCHMSSMAAWSSVPLRAIALRQLQQYMDILLASVDPWWDVAMAFLVSGCCSSYIAVLQEQFGLR